MSRKPRATSKVEDKYNEPLPSRLRELVTNTAELSTYLGCSNEAVRQYRLGTTQPTLDKLIQIAKYYNVSADYLLGLTNVKSTDVDIRRISQHTGLSEESIENLQNIHHYGKFQLDIGDVLGEIPLFIVDYILSKPFLFEFLSNLANKFHYKSFVSFLKTAECCSLFSYAFTDEMRATYNRDNFAADCLKIYDELEAMCTQKFHSEYKQSYTTLLAELQEEMEENIDRISAIQEKLKKEM